ncbi:MAG: diguanylate cyclase [Cyanobacteriota bacterium]|nr:diguanylate cyclase [Cyanobacteriota bacterium]
MKAAFQSLIVKLILYYSLLSLLLVGIVGGLTFMQARADLEEVLFESLNATANLKADTLNLWIDSQQEATLALAQLPEIRTQAAILLKQPTQTTSESQTAYRLLSQYLAAALSSRPEFTEIGILNATDGQVVVSTNKGHEGQHRAQDPYFVQGQQTTYLQNVYASPVTAHPTITIATPLLETSGKPVGVLATHLDLVKMLRVLQGDPRPGETTQTYLVDPYHTLIAGDRFGSPDFPLGIRSPGIDAAIAGNSGEGIYLNYRGMEVMGVYRWLAGRELALLVEEPTAIAFYPARSLFLTILLTGLLVTTLLMAGVFWIARQIAYPILRITEAATKVAAGDLTLTAPVVTQDEIGVLAQAFNQMTQRLRRLYTGMEDKVQQLQSEIQERQRIEAALQKANQELVRLSILDGLTRIANRRRFDSYLQQEWQRMKEFQEPLSLILCDVDCFKLYNDAYGHQQGDECLQQIAQAISRATKRPRDLVARYGGEEFAVILPNTHLEGALQVARTIQTEVRSLQLPHEDSLVDSHVTLSQGIATAFFDQKYSPEDLIAAADHALYEAKGAGRNQIRFEVNQSDAIDTFVS